MAPNLHEHLGRPLVPPGCRTRSSIDVLPLLVFLLGRVCPLRIPMLMPVGGQHGANASMLGSGSSNAATSTPPVGTNSPSSTNDLTRDPEFWLEDGNIVLVAHNVAFRVYRGLISKQSQIFHDMFASSETGPMMFDNCPIVHLSDSPSDFRHLLRVLIPAHCRR